MTDQVLITLPLPTRELSPNSRCHWRTKAAAVKRYRELARLATYVGGGMDCRWEHAIADVAFYWPDRRSRDADNALASLKAAWDGMRDVGLIVDDNTRVLRLAECDFHIDGKNPRVEITVTRC